MYTGIFTVIVWGNVHRRASQKSASLLSSVLEKHTPRLTKYLTREKEHSLKSRVQSWLGSHGMAVWTPTSHSTPETWFPSGVRERSLQAYLAVLIARSMLTPRSSPPSMRCLITHFLFCGSHQLLFSSGKWLLKACQGVGLCRWSVGYANPGSSLSSWHRFLNSCQPWNSTDPASYLAVFTPAYCDNDTHTKACTWGPSRIQSCGGGSWSMFPIMVLWDSKEASLADPCRYKHCRANQT